MTEETRIVEDGTAAEVAVVEAAEAETTTAPAVETPVAEVPVAEVVVERRLVPHAGSGEQLPDRRPADATLGEQALARQDERIPRCIPGRPRGRLHMSRHVPQPSMHFFNGMSAARRRAVW